MRSIEQRLAEKLRCDDGHLIFTGVLDVGGYGLLWDPRRRNNSKAHRIAYELWVGAIPAGMQVHHECGVRACCEPSHLTLMASGAHAKHHHPLKTHCPHGHPYDEVNSRWNGSQQVCRTCQRAAGASWAKRNRARINARRRELYASRRNR